MTDLKLYINCKRCNGTGIFTPEIGEPMSCASCIGTGKYEQEYFNIDSVIDLINVKLDVLTDKINDILDKCNDIKEKCDEIF